MNLSKKKLNQINGLSVFTEVIYNHLSEKRDSLNNVMEVGKRFLDFPPEIWSKDEKLIFDILSEVEYKLKDKIILELTQKKGGGNHSATPNPKTKINTNA